MADVVYQARLDMLRRNLELVGDVFGELERRFRHPAAGSSPVDLSTPLADVRHAFDRVRDAIRDRDFDAAAPSVNDLHRALYELDLKATELRPAKSQLPSRDQMSNVLASQAQQLFARVDQLGQSKAPLVDRWPVLLDLEAEAREVFSEYVDLVRGAAMRSMEMDGQLCGIADQLVRQVQATDWRSLTIPARRELQGASSAAIIRIGFPGWSVFSLPLAAHEYGHVVVASMAAAGRLQIEGIDAGLERVLLADVYAATTVGPCYALALFSTRLDLRRRDHVHRARVVLAALDELANGGEASPFVDTIRAEWQSVADVVLTDSIDPIDPAPLLAAMRTRVFGVRFPAADWQGIVVPLAADLRQRRAEEINVHPTADVRHVFNAAWVARLDAGGDYQTIEETARDLCLELGRSRSGSSAREQPMPQRPQPRPGSGP